MKRTTFLALTMAALVASLLPSSAAEACSASACRGGFSLPASGNVPANLPALLWVPKVLDPAAMPGPADVSLVQKTAAGEVNVPIVIEALPDSGLGPERLVKPLAPLTPNADYVLRSKDGCDPNAPPIEAAFHTVDAAPLPSTLGTLSLSGQGFTSLSVSTVSGSCSSPIQATVQDVSLVASADAAPWKDVLAFETLINGMPYRPASSLVESIPKGQSWVGRGQDRLFAACGRSNDEGADQGLLPLTSQNVVLRATLYGTNVVLETEPVVAMLTCPGIDYVDDPAGGASESGCAIQNSPSREGRREGRELVLLAFAALFAGRRLNRPSSRRDGSA